MRVAGAEEARWDAGSTERASAEEADVVIVVVFAAATGRARADSLRPARGGSRRLLRIGSRSPSSPCSRSWPPRRHGAPTAA